MPKVWIPLQLRAVTNGEAEVNGNGDTVDEVMVDLERQFPGLKERVFDDKGELRPHLAIFVNDEDIRFLEGGKTPVTDRHEISMIPAVGGG